MPVANITELTVCYGSKPAVNNISVEIPEGCTGLLGPNGAGKTTLLKTLLGFLRPSHGKGEVLEIKIDPQVVDPEDVEMLEDLVVSAVREALEKGVSVMVVLLGLSVLFWVAGFDILYALQDLEFDRQAHLHSIPVRLGVTGSLWMARLFSLLMIVLLVVVYTLLPVGGYFLAGILLATLLLVYEHWLLRGGDLGRLDMAFFTMNGYISIIIFIATLVDVTVGKGGS